MVKNILNERIMTFILMVGSVSSIYAQDSTFVTKPIISGFADAYFRYSFLNLPPAEDSFGNFTSFTNSHNSFELGMLSVKLEQSIGKVGLVGDLGFGKRAQDFSYNDENSMLAIKQLYLSYSPFDNFKLTGGSWATHIGYEVVDAPGNRNYSMSYMFSYGPFFHTGLKADYGVGKSGFMMGFVNPSDLKSANFSKKYLIGQYRLALADSKVNLSINGLAGKMDKDSRNNQFDLVATAAVSAKFTLGYNATLASSATRATGDSWISGNGWWGSALYFNYDPDERVGISLRAEYFSDSNGITAPFLVSKGGSVKAATLSFNGKISNLVLIPELRIEDSNRQIFTKKSGTASNSLSFIFGAYYKF